MCTIADAPPSQTNVGSRPNTRRTERSFPTLLGDRDGAERDYSLKIPAPSAYLLGKWLRRKRQRPSIRLAAYPSNTTRCRPPPRGVQGLRSHPRASRRAIYARSCKQNSEKASTLIVIRSTFLGAENSEVPRGTPRIDAQLQTPVQTEVLRSDIQWRRAPGAGENLSSTH